MWRWCSNGRVFLWRLWSGRKHEVAALVERVVAQMTEPSGMPQTRGRDSGAPPGFSARRTGSRLASIIDTQDIHVKFQSSPDSESEVLSAQMIRGWVTQAGWGGVYDAILGINTSMVIDLELESKCIPRIQTSLPACCPRRVKSHSVAGELARRLLTGCARAVYILLSTE